MRNADKAKVIILQMEAIATVLSKQVSSSKDAISKVTVARPLHVYVKSLEEKFREYERMFVSVMGLLKGDEEEAPTSEYKQLMDDVADAKIQLELKIAMLESPAKSKLTSTPQVSGKLPKVTVRSFDQQDPGLWFKELENQFRAFAVVDESNKFALLLSVIGSCEGNAIATVTSQCEALSDPYSQAKLKLIDLYKLKPFDAIQKVLDLEYDCGEKPTQFLGRVETILSDITMEDVKTYLVTRHLSQTVRITLQGNDSLANTEQVAKRADLLVTEKPLPSVNQVKILCSLHKKDKESRQCLGTPQQKCPLWRYKYHRKRKAIGSSHVEISENFKSGEQ